MLFHSSNERGLTLIELLVTVALVAVVASIAIPVLLNTVSTAQTKADAASAANTAAFTAQWSSAGYTVSEGTGANAGFLLALDPATGAVVARIATSEPSAPQPLTGLIGGYVFVDGVPAAAIWDLSNPDSPTIMQSRPDQTGSIGIGMSSQYLVGSAYTSDGWAHAVAWTIADGAGTDLWPLDDGVESYAYGVSGNIAVGDTGDLDGDIHAVYWNITTGAGYYLPVPANAIESHAIAIDGNYAVGYINSGGHTQGIAWNIATGAYQLLDGTDAGPAGVSGTTAVGSSADGRALVWDVVTGAVTQLDNIGGNAAAAGGISGNYVVGLTALPGQQRAAAWNLATGQAAVLQTPNGTITSRVVAVSGDLALGYFTGGNGSTHYVAWNLTTGAMTYVGIAATSAILSAITG